MGNYNLGSLNSIPLNQNYYAASTSNDLQSFAVPPTYQGFDQNQVFSLNSNPGADHTIYLDFDGHTTTGTIWNNEYGSSIVTPRYDTDGDTSNFSTTELENIWRIWQRVSEDFSPFEVNVTTSQPSSDQLIKSGDDDTQWGIRVAIGGDNSWYGDAGGVAYLGSFNWDADTPTFVFSDNIRGGDEKGVAEAITHEVGHTLGLTHDGNSTDEYYTGHGGNGSIGWAPIMGVAYDKELSQWSRGEYNDANNQEDDLDIITGQNGFGYRPDDYGDDRINASALSSDGTQTYGIIETNTDTDWFGFTSTTGNIDLDILPFERGPNLDILAQLYDSAGNLIESSNPTGSLSANFDLQLDPGQYYLSVTGTGAGDPATGYSDYGSLGQYSISGNIV